MKTARKWLAEIRIKNNNSFIEYVEITHPFNVCEQDAKLIANQIFITRMEYQPLVRRKVNQHITPSNYWYVGEVVSLE